jgi:hypothetical protein
VHRTSREGTALFVDDTWIVETELGPYGSGLIAGFEGDVAFYRDEIDPPEPTLVASSTAEWHDTAVSPQDFYAGFWKSQGQLPPTELVLDTEQVAVVNASYAAPLSSVDLVNEVTVYSYLPSLGSGAMVYEFELPLDRTEHYYSADPDVRWLNELWMHDAEFTRSIILGWVPYEYRAGETYTSRWNEPVFSPSMPELIPVFRWIDREGDLLLFELPVYGDSQGHGGFIGGEGTSTLYRNGELFGQTDGAAAAPSRFPQTRRATVSSSISSSSSSSSRRTSKAHGRSSRATWQRARARTSPCSSCASPPSSTREDVPRAIRASACRSTSNNTVSKSRPR